jgi:uncharacterized membrane protein
VDTSESAEFVPGVAIIVTFVLVIVSIMVLVLYVNHIGRRLRAASLIEAVGHQMRSKLDELYPERETEEPQSPGVLFAPRSGVLIHIDHTRLVDLARKAGVALEVLPALGDFVPAGAPLLRIRGQPKFDIASDILRRITLDKERSFDQDLAYGPRLLVISACARSPTRSTRQPLCKPSTVSTTLCASSCIGGFRAVSTVTKPVLCGW